MVYKYMLRRKPTFKTMHAFKNAELEKDVFRNTPVMRMAAIVWNIDEMQIHVWSFKLAPVIIWLRSI